MDCTFTPTDVHGQYQCKSCGFVVNGIRVLPIHRVCKTSKQVDRQENSFKSFSGGGPGTQLSKLLKRFGIEPTPTCKCRSKAQQMDEWGPEECSRPERIEEVLAVMRDEAKARGLPFIDAVGRMLIRRAIKNAKRAASS